MTVPQTDHKAKCLNIELTPKQTIFFDAVFDQKKGHGFISDNKFNEFASFGGYGSAKSFSVMLCTLYICNTYPKTEWLYCRATYRELEDSVISQFISTFPPEYYKYIYRKQEKCFVFWNGSKIIFRAFDKDNKILSNMYHGASLCQGEELEYELFLQLWGRLRLKLPGVNKNILLIEGNPANNWCKNRYIDKRPSNVFFLQSSTEDNPHNPKNYVETLKREYPKHWVDRYVYGEWANFDEMVFSEFRGRSAVIDPFEIPSWYQKANGFDYGWRNPSGIVYMAKDDEGNVFVYDEFKKPEQTTKELAIEANRHGAFVNVIDPSTKSPDRDGKDVFGELVKEGLFLIEANKRKDQNILLINTLLRQKKLFIFKNCVETIKEIENYKWKKLKLGEAKNLPDEVVKKDDHLVDALMYVTQFITDGKAVDPVKEMQRLRHIDEIYQRHITKELISNYA